MKNLLATLSAIVVGVLAIDVLGFFAWALSGQFPPDNFYVGTITAHALRAVLGI